MEIASVKDRRGWGAPGEVQTWQVFENLPGLIIFSSNGFEAGAQFTAPVSYGIMTNSQIATDS
jgi:hypothetical protein